MNRSLRSVQYTVEPQPDYQDSVLVACMQIHQDEPPGDILCFLTGQVCAFRLDSRDAKGA
jgi:hypothetical protein